MSDETQDLGPNYTATRHDSERVILGSLFLNPHETLPLWRVTTTCVPNATEKLFRDRNHRTLMGLMVDMLEKGMPMDYGTLLPEIHKRGLVDDVGSISYIHGHMDYFWDVPVNTRWHINKLIHDWRRQKIAEHGAMLMEEAATTDDPNLLLADVTSWAQGLMRVESSMVTPSTEVMNDTVEKMFNQERGEEDIVRSCFSNLQNLCGGHRRQQMTVVGAPSGCGKTAYAMQEIFHACLSKETGLGQGLVCDAFLMESDMQQVFSRFTSQRYNIHAQKWITRRFTQEETRRTLQSKQVFEEMAGRLHLAPRRAYNASSIAAMVQERKAKTGQPCDLIVVDYIQSMGPSRPGWDASEHKSIHENVKQLWELAARENAAIIVLSQLTMDAIRNSFSQKTKRPGLGAFKGSGAITETAKVVVILFKDEQDMLDSDVVEQEFVVAKANDGAMGIVPSLLVKPFVFHMEDCTAADRAAQLAKLQALRFDPNQSRSKRR